MGTLNVQMCLIKAKNGQNFKQNGQIELRHEEQHENKLCQMQCKLEKGQNENVEIRFPVGWTYQSNHVWTDFSALPLL